MKHSFDITDNEFELLKGLIYNQTGICLDDCKKAFLASRLRKRLASLHLNSFREYYNYLIGHPRGQKEMMQMISLITTGKTEFFREEEHFKFLTTNVFPYFLKRTIANQRRPELYIWSAGCSTGEEAYSLAMVTNDFFNVYPYWQIEILATDIDIEALNKAKAGIYTEKEISSLPLTYRKRYFHKIEPQKFKANDTLRRLITFKYLNLSTAPFYFGRKFDVIFCRNVIIYLHPEIKKKIIQGFYTTLADDGFLFLGHSESLLSLDRGLFSLVTPSIYQKASLGISSNARL